MDLPRVRRSASLASLLLVTAAWTVGPAGCVEPIGVVDVDVVSDTWEVPDGYYGGHRNGVVDVGETLGLRPRLLNRTGNDLLSVSATISTSSDAVYLDDDERQQVYDDMLDGQEDRPASPFIVTFQAESPPGDVEFLLTVVDSHEGEIGQTTFFVRSRQVNLTLANWTVDDDSVGASDGDGDGLVERGERVELRADLVNLGPEPFPLLPVDDDAARDVPTPRRGPAGEHGQTIRVTLSTVADGIEVLGLDNPPSFDTDIPPGESASTPADFDFVVDGAATSTEVCFDAEILLEAGMVSYTFVRESAFCTGIGN